LVFAASQSLRLIAQAPALQVEAGSKEGKNIRLKERESAAAGEVRISP
jgi:hypothetical protein